MGSDLIVIAVAGASGSGKSLLSHTIVDELGSEYVTVITEDSYYKDHSNMSFEELQHLNYDHPNAFDHDLLVSHLQALKAGKSIEVPIYDYATHRRIEKARAVTSSQRIVVLEGILLLNDAQLRELTDIKILLIHQWILALSVA
jgi:uridine kinase